MRARLRHLEERVSRRHRPRPRRQTAQNGAVRYRKGSHRNGLLPHVDHHYGLRADEACVDHDAELIVAELSRVRRRCTAGSCCTTARPTCPDRRGSGCSVGTAGCTRGSCASDATAFRLTCRSMAGRSFSAADCVAPFAVHPRGSRNPVRPFRASLPPNCISSVQDGHGHRHSISRGMLWQCALGENGTKTDGETERTL